MVMIVCCAVAGSSCAVEAADVGFYPAIVTRTSDYARVLQRERTVLGSLPSGLVHVEVGAVSWIFVPKADRLSPRAMQALLDPPPTSPKSPSASGEVGQEDCAIGGAAFAFASSQIARQDFGAVIDQAKAHPDVSVIVVGHTDARGSDAYNCRLGHARADTVVASLAAAGINKQKILVGSQGMRNPIGDNLTEQGRAANRRASVWVQRGIEDAAPGELR